MFKQLRGPERLFRIGQWGIALLFAFFLVQIGASVIADLPGVTREPTLEAFTDQAAIRRAEATIAPVERRMLELGEQAQALRDKLDTARENYDKDKESFENWKATRSSTARPEQDPEVVSRARNLDAQLEVQRQIEAQIRDTEARRRQQEASIQPAREAIARIQETAQRQFEEAVRADALKAFFIRLLFVGPVLLLGIWVFRKYRKSRQWPFAWGFIFFALFAFFFELVPYLPSFGGYIRYGVGAVLTFLGGRALINALQRYLERKQQEQAAPREERKLDISYEKSLASIAKEQCPSCERKLPAVEGSQVNFCMHCGLKLFKCCGHCGLRHYAFFPFCPSCGTGSDAVDAPGSGPTAGAAKPTA